MYLVCPNFRDIRILNAYYSLSMKVSTSSVSAVLPFQRPNGIAYVPGKDIADFRGNCNLIYVAFLTPFINLSNIADYFWNKKIIL